jgi:hypothetical protein
VFFVIFSSWASWLKDEGTGYRVQGSGCREQGQRRFPASCILYHSLQLLLKLLDLAGELGIISAHVDFVGAKKKLLLIKRGECKQ